MNRKILFHSLLIICLFSALLNGCATKETVMENIESSEEKQAQKIAELRQELTAEINNLEGTEKNANEAMKMARDNSQAINRLRSDFASRDKLTEKMDEKVYFSFDKHTLDNEAKSTLNQVANMLNKDENCLAVIEGHTDSKGSESYNYALSNRRVASVIGYLSIEKNVDLNQIHLVGLGEGYPDASNTSEEGRRQNRRVAIKIMAPR